MNKMDWGTIDLGQRSDKMIADSIGVTPLTVSRQRARMGIPLFCGRKSGIDWDKVEFGKMPDKELSCRLRVSPNAVRQQRIKRGIARFPVGGNACWIDWDKIPLGSMPDSVIAKMTGRHIMSVSEARRSRGIAKYSGRCITTEGEIATYPEALIDLWMHEHRIDHKFQVKIKPYIADWVCDKTVYEYAGLLDHRNVKIRDYYTSKLVKKTQFYKDSGFDVVVITPKELSLYAPKGAVLCRSSCVLCGSKSGRMKKGMCLVCYSKNRPISTFPRNGELACVTCGRLFGSYGRRGGLVRHISRGECQSCFDFKRKGN
jgi:hypothetical protein